MAKSIASQTTTIPSSGTTSAAVTMERNRVPLQVIMPAGFNGTAITFESSVDGTTFQPLYNESTLYSITVSTTIARTYALNRQVMDGVKFIRIVSNGTESATRTISIVSGE